MGTDHLAILRTMSQGDMSSALELLLTANPLPEATGRLSPEVYEETLCQNRRGDRVSLRAIERFIAENIKYTPVTRARTAQDRPRVAVIGSGPSGLSAAWELARGGYRVTVLESSPVCGGTLSYAWGAFQFPAQAMRSILSRFDAAGIKFMANILFGKLVMPTDLFEQGYAAVLIATGAGKLRVLDIQGENAAGIIDADDLLKAVHWRREDPVQWLGPKVLVVGDNETAFTCARLALRAKREVTVIVRGPETQIQASAVFVRHAVEEGVKIKAFTNPIRAISGQDGCVAGLACRYLDYRMDGKGRLVLQEDGSSEFTLDAQTVIRATGWDANSLFLRDIAGLEFNADGSLRTKPELAETGLNGVFACGAVIEPAMSLTDTMLSGRRAAAEIDKFLSLSS